MVKNSHVNAGESRDMGLILGSGRPPREGNGNPFKYSCLGNFMDRGALAGYNTRGCKDSDVIEQAQRHRNFPTRTFTLVTVTCDT